MKLLFVLSLLVFCTTSEGTRSPRCMNVKGGEGNDLPNLEIPKRTWLETPSVVKINEGHYRALGRVIHVKYLKEQLETRKKLDFSAVRETMDNFVERLDIFADTIYIEDQVAFFGIKHVKINAREIVASGGSKLEFSAPNWEQQFKQRVTTGRKGDDGEHGEDGPQVDVLCDSIIGDFNLDSNGGNGHEGQDGGDGFIGRSSLDQRPPQPVSACTDQSYDNCKDVAGEVGQPGGDGGDGGDAGAPGNGGNGGRIKFRFANSKLTGKFQVTTCAGAGAQPAKNGIGGKGGKGGIGGEKRNCEQKRGYALSVHGVTVTEPDKCISNGLGDKAANGAPGDDGANGTTPNVKGQDGLLDDSFLDFAPFLPAEEKQRYPVELLEIMNRLAEDRLLANSADQRGKDVLTFLASFPDEGPDVKRIKDDAKRKLRYVGKDGFDIFRNVKLFAPSVKWEGLEEIVEDVKAAAVSYEEAFNSILSSVQSNNNFKQMASTMKKVSSLHVKAEKKRLIESRLIAESQKRMYFKAIQAQEDKMECLLSDIKKMLPTVYANAKFNPDDFMALLEGFSGYVSATASKDPIGALTSAFGIVHSFSGKCMGPFESALESIEKWLTFGKEFKPLNNSSELDFDQVDVSSVPEIMQANLEMNKETLTAELVCLLETASRPQDVAKFKSLIEEYFITGSARIDLIGKIMDLDNEMGGYNFDIPLLEKTQKAIADVNKSPDADISEELKETFTEYLLSTYRELERSFMRHLYYLQKAFEFRMLWKGKNLLAKYQRLASESARGIGRLNGAVQLTELLQKAKDLKYKAAMCFTNNMYATDIHKWSFDSVKNEEMFKQLASKGRTMFSIHVDQSCDKCYNVRLLKIYIELYGTNEQKKKVPAKVYLQVRHLSASYFRDGSNKIRQYHQPVSAFRKISFDRFKISDEEECRKSKSKDENTKYCVTEEDSRWEQMCSDPLNKLGSCQRVNVLGMEECKSPFGTYELKIPVDKKLSCVSPKMKNTNCKHLDLSKFTNMNVWIHYYYWPDQYPKGPDDPICKIPSYLKRNETVAITEHPPSVPDKEQC